jgi:GNAT superfamily N-acetyltransferase
MEQSQLSFEIFDLSKDDKCRFDHLMSKKALSVMERVAAYGIGITVTEDKGLVPAGTIVFSLDMTDAPEEMPAVMELHWLYVDEEYRKKGVATRLMEIFAEIINSSEVGSIICDVPLNSDYDELTAFLEGWGFEFYLTEKNEQILTWEDIRQHPVLGQPVKSQNVFSLNTFSNEQISKCLRILQLKNWEDFLIAETDLQLSCICIKDNVPKGILLIRRNPEYMLEPLLIETAGKSETSLPVAVELLSHAILEVPPQFKRDSFIYVLIRRLEGAQLWDSLFPDRPPALIRRGINILEKEAYDETR